MKIGIFSGSARPERKSHNVALEAQKRLEARDGIETDMFDVLEMNLPLLYNPIYDQDEPTEQILDISARMKKQDAFLMVTPEHNGSYSGALKNTLDYFGPEYTKKAIGIVAVSSGMLGGANAGRELQLWAMKINCVPVPQFLLTPKVNKVFDNSGNLIDESWGGLLDNYLDEFLWYAEALKAAREK